MYVNREGKVVYAPDRELRNLGNHGPLGFRMDHLTNHISGLYTYGHYLLDSDDQCRVFCYDIDLKPNSDTFTGHYMPDIINEEVQPVPFDAREAWLDRSHPSRAWTKIQMGMLARKLVSAIFKELGGVPGFNGAVASYSGNKGIHVYGFVDPQPAEGIRLLAHHVLDVTDDWELERGEHIYRYKLQDPFMGYPNFNLEVYPKQDSLDGKDLGNLIRLPLGKHLKNPGDPTFFLDLRTAPGVMTPHPDPVRLLDSGDPYLD